MACLASGQGILNKVLQNIKEGSSDKALDVTLCNTKIQDLKRQRFLQIVFVRKVKGFINKLQFYFDSQPKIIHWKYSQINQ